MEALIILHNIKLNTLLIHLSFLCERDIIKNLDDSIQLCLEEDGESKNYSKSLNWKSDKMKSTLKYKI
jgi:hypothetical protein